jgi:hypothetical protein
MPCGRLLERGFGSNWQSSVVRWWGHPAHRHRLLVAERGKWIEFSGAARGDEAGEQAGENDDEDRAGEGPRIGRLDVPQLITDETRCSPGAEYPNADSAGDQDSSSSQDAAQDVAPLRAERHANAGLVRLQRDIIGHHAIDADISL